MDEQLQDLLKGMQTSNASDLHLTPGKEPQYRISGDLVPVKNDPLTPDRCQTMLYSVLDEHSRKAFEQEKELDFSVGLPGEGRFRVNIYMQRGSMAAAFRRLPFEIPDFEELGLPVERMESLASTDKGMILVTGATGSGKSTTLASMIDYINRHYSKHIICLEDPIEYIYKHQKATVNQREVGQDTYSFPGALRYVLRQDPDVVQIGEMRDQESIRSMLTVAETGHLAFSTLHTNTAPSTITRIIDVFPQEQQEQIRVQLSMTLHAVISQQLVPHANGKELVLAYELMLTNSAIRNIIRQNQKHQLYGQIQLNTGKGMQTMNASLARLVKTGKITRETAELKCTDAKELQGLLRRDAT